MDIASLVEQLRADGALERIARDPRAQFGTPGRRYIGAELLPEVNQPENAYREDRVKYRTVIANSGTRYSPAQKKDGDLVGSFLVELGESDIAREFTARQYDALLRLLERNATMDAVTSLTGWLNTTVTLALAELVEQQRWQAIVNAQVVRQGDNGYTDTVVYSNPAGHRVTAGDDWSDNGYDPYTDITAGADMLASKGYQVGRIITSRKVRSILARNATMAARSSRIVLAGGALTNIASSGVDATALNSFLSADGLPEIETYELMYRTQTGQQRFLPDNVMVMTATLDRDPTIDYGDLDKIQPQAVGSPSLLGYAGIGRTTGEATPGRVIRAWAKDDKPPRIVAEGWQTALPVILEPEAVFVIGSIQ